MGVVRDASPRATRSLWNALFQVKTLIGVDCSRDPQWCTTVLEQVQPHLVALELISPGPQHLEQALGMVHLHSLCLVNATGSLLEQVHALPSLRHLEVHARPEEPLPLVQQPPQPASRLRSLRLGAHPLPAALALARAHAATLKELQLVAATTEPYGCPDLARELRACGLVKLKRLVLLRENAFGEFCRHDESSCRAQVVSCAFSLLEQDCEVVCGLNCRKV